MAVEVGDNKRVPHAPRRLGQDGQIKPSKIHGRDCITFNTFQNRWCIDDDWPLQNVRQGKNMQILKTASCLACTVHERLPLAVPLLVVQHKALEAFELLLVALILHYMPALPEDMPCVF